MKTKQANIERFLAAKKMAIAGVSKDPKKFGHVVYQELKERGYEVYPINPTTDSMDGIPCYSSVGALPAGIDHLLVLTRKPQTPGVIKDAVERGIKNIWIQQMSETPETLALINDKDINFIHKQCILMFVEPVAGVHKFHRVVKKFFGLLPK